jgi:hypothetical protein
MANFDPDCYLLLVGRTVLGLRLLAGTAIAAITLATGACSRTGLPILLTDFDGGIDLVGDERSSETRPPASADASADGSKDAPSEDARAPMGSCDPAPEVCNGKDDDCNGQVDDGLAAVPCPGGGNRYCVAGRLSECPTRCEVCLPGSQRTCFLSYCRYWGLQTCTADGRSFSVCRESDPPAECAAIAKSRKDSPELEQCCIDSGYCCLDEFDLNHNGNTSELLGRCDEVLCAP